MNTNILGQIYGMLYIVVIIIFAKLFEKLGKEASRKFVHIMLANWYFIAMSYFDNSYSASFLPALFIIINYLSLKKKLINVMERDNQSEETFGTVFYAISLTILTFLTFGFYIYKPQIGLIGILIMGYGDGLAAVIGKNIKTKEYHFKGNTKTIGGSLTMFLVTLLLIFGYVHYYDINYNTISLILSSIIITLVEGLSIKGLDNITVPLISSLIAYCLF